MTNPTPGVYSHRGDDCPRHGPNVPHRQRREPHGEPWVCVQCIEARAPVVDTTGPTPGEFERLRGELKATQRELDRWQRGQMAEGDFIRADGSVVDCDPWHEAEKAREEIDRLRGALSDIREAAAAWAEESDNG